jgi:serine/threonine protein phosphatase PrpC
MSSDAQRDSEPASAAADDGRTQGTARSNGRIVVRCAGRTAVGQVRDHNEDNFVVANLGTGQIVPRDLVFEDDVLDRGLIFAVCDGMGGAAAGEVASQMAVDILVEAMRRGGTPRNRDALARRLVSSVEEAGRRIFDSAQKERSRRGMGTTATVAVLIDKVLFLAEVGDSRGYMLRRGQLKQLTKDQSLVNQLIEAGHLTEDEAEAFEHSNIILQALGTSETVQVDLTFVELRRGDRLMMCSDGLSGLVHADALRSALDEIKDPSECCAKLIEYAETAGGHDNITVVVADFDGEGISDAAEGDTFGYVQYPLPLADDDANAFGDEETTGGGRERPSDPEAVGDEGEDDSSVFEQDHDESLLPLTMDGDDARGSALWVVAGLAALIIAGVIWFKLRPEANEQLRADEHAVAPEPAAPQAPTNPDPAQPQAGTAAAAAAAPDAQEVEVNIHTDVERATLLVNGEAKGEISSEQSRSLKLRPGAYRFDAQSEGTQVAVTVVTVRGDMPMDVFLELPKGASEQPQQGAKPPATEVHEAAAPAVRPAEDGEAASAARARREAARAARTAAAAKREEAASAERPAAAAPKPAPSSERDKAQSPLPNSAEASAQPKPPATPPTPAPTPKPQDIPDNPV